MDKKEAAAAKQDFELHCALIRKQEGRTSNAARFIAWSEGPAGLARRLGTPELPLAPAQPDQPKKA